MQATKRVEGVSKRSAELEEAVAAVEGHTKRLEARVDEWQAALDAAVQSKVGGPLDRPSMCSELVTTVCVNHAALCVQQQCP